MRRPPLTASTPVSDRASSKGEYQGATRVDVPSSTRSVTLAATLSATNGSSMVRGCHGIVSVSM
ncbi:hypothetical protein J2S50_007101 [Streptomyces sp. DSM 40167]|nr:hypothetical protein [Streptomyces sp. DSM 40167]